MPQQLLGVPDRPRLLAPRFEQFGQPRHRRQVAPQQPFALAEDPLVVAPGEQLAAVEPDRLLQGGERPLAALPLRPRDRRIERGDIEPE